MTGAWGKAYLKWIAKGCDNGDAAYRADQAERRAAQVGRNGSRQDRATGATSADAPKDSSGSPQ